MLPALRPSNRAILRSWACDHEPVYTPPPIPSQGDHSSSLSLKYCLFFNGRIIALQNDVGFYQTSSSLFMFISLCLSRSSTCSDICRTIYVPFHWSQSPLRSSRFCSCNMKCLWEKDLPFFSQGWK